MASKGFATKSKSLYFKVAEDKVMLMQIYVCPDVHQTKRTCLYTWFTLNHLAALLSHLRDVILARSLSCASDKEITQDGLMIFTPDKSFNVHYQFKRRAIRQFVVIKSQSLYSASRKTNYSGGGHKDFTFFPEKLVVTVSEMEQAPVHQVCVQPISQYFTKTHQDSVTDSAIKKQANLRNIVKKMEQDKEKELDLSCPTTSNPTNKDSANPSTLTCITTPPNSSKVPKPSPKSDKELGDITLSRDRGIGDSRSSVTASDDKTKDHTQISRTLACVATSVEEMVTCGSRSITCTQELITCTTSFGTCLSSAATAESFSSSVTCSYSQQQYPVSSRKRLRSDSAIEDPNTRSAADKILNDNDDDEDFTPGKLTVKMRQKKRRKEESSYTANSKVAPDRNKRGKLVKEPRGTANEAKETARLVRDGAEKGSSNRHDADSECELQVISTEAEAQNSTGTSRTDAITISDVPPDFRQINDIADLTSEHIEYLVGQMAKQLKQIFKGKAYCRRHEDYKTGGRTRGDLAFQVRFGPFSADQQEAVMQSLIGIFCSKTTKITSPKCCFPRRSFSSIPGCAEGHVTRLNIC
ncbi:uncharacterized protein LOC5510779 isoform X2 [Nematostella vectensis]|uniref:uncharacterized protein LOC5510779 isoform X2 n=1 Tax=Nematostella vectensis TaxID=45351 RepID=UPI002076F8B9|nr:uncharacterized protein LOC5510779 isoform X2 [Nematostella vectensis]